MATTREVRGPVKTDTAEADLRKGKWTIEEENYANKIITLFNQGMLPVVVGTTLRTYLSDKLRCDPMRITKKYAGASCIGKQVFQLADNYYEAFQENERELQRLEALFLARINGKGSGMANKRNGSSDALSAHHSIYETTNPDRALATPRTAQSATKRAPKEPKKSTPRGASQNRTPIMNASMGCESPGKYRRNIAGEAFFSDAAAQDYYQDDEEDDEDDDYGYAYDPDSGDESAPVRNNGAASFALFHPNNASAVAGGGVATSAAEKIGSWDKSSMGRRVLSAPNLSELGLSSWKETDYHPMPADSLKEMFSLPIHRDSGGLVKAGATKPQNAAAAALGIGAHASSLLPEHVYSALGNESGRYARTTAGDRGSQASRARATRLAYNEYLSSAGSAASNHISALDDSVPGMYRGVGSGGVQSYNSFQAGKRSFSAMALVDFEKLAGDDAAAGDLFLEFLSKVGGRTGATPSPAIAAATAAITTVPDVKKEQIFEDEKPNPVSILSSTGPVGPCAPIADAANTVTTTCPSLPANGMSIEASALVLQKCTLDNVASVETDRNASFMPTDRVTSLDEESNSQHESMVLG